MQQLHMINLNASTEAKINMILAERVFKCKFLSKDWL